MAYPIVTRHIKTQLLAILNGVPFALTLPADVQVGERLGFVVAWDNGNDEPIVASIHSGTGWTIAWQENALAALGGRVLEKLAADGDDAVSIVLNDMGVAENGTVVGFAVSGIPSSTPLALAWQEYADIHPGDPTNTPDSPSLTVPWALTDTLFLTAHLWDNASRTHAAWPAGYADNRMLNPGPGTSAGVGLALATRNVRAVTENPPAGAISADDQWMGLTMAFRGTDDPPPPATAITLEGPGGGVVAVASTPFVVGANGAITGTRTVTPSDGDDGGTFTPASVEISTGAPTAEFTYTPDSPGVKSITLSNDGGLTNPAAHPYTATAAAVAPTISSQPSAATVTAPTAAAFSVGISGVYTGIQWQYSTDGTTLAGSVVGGSGATGITYTTGATAVSSGSHRNGYHYRAAVAWSGGTVFSDWAPLTVNAPVGGGGDVRLTFQVGLERGGEAALVAGLEWLVFNAARNQVVASGTGLALNSVGEASLTVLGSPFAVGDWVTVELCHETGETNPADRTVTPARFYVQAAAI